jgi:hypothetical protein
MTYLASILSVVSFYMLAKLWWRTPKAVMRK